jgi:anti-sigma factor RsiW
MRSLHADGDVLARYVIGLLDTGELDRVERHVATCDECARALGAEARAETRLRATIAALERPTGGKVVALPRRAAAPAPAPRSRSGFANGFAAAAALVLAVWSLGARGPAAVPGVSAAAMARISDGVLLCELDRVEPLCRAPTPGGQSLATPDDLGAAVEGNICRAPIGVCRAP